MKIRVSMRAIFSGIVAAIIICAVGFIAWGEPKFGEISHDTPLSWSEIQKTPQEHTKLNLKKPLREQIRRIELAGRTFDIPIMFVDGWLKPGVAQDSLLLEVIWPEMRSTYELKDRAEYEKIWREERRRGSILIEPASIRPKLDVQVGNMERTMTKVVSLGKTEGFEKYLWYRGPPNNPKLQHEVYLIRNKDGSITDYIDCKRPLDPTVQKIQISYFPTCSHRFVNGGLLYKITYNEKRFFPEWSKQKNRALQFIKNIEIFSESQKGE